MSTTISLYILELLSSKICHDLISPVGAVANGVEFLEEMGADAGDEAIDLIKFSAIQASAKLQAYRMAYGAGGADTSIKPEDVYNTFAKLIELDKKVIQDWDPYAPLGPDERPAGFAKLLMCGLLLAMDCLPKGGTLKVLDGDGDSIQIQAEGVDANFKTENQQALDGKMHESVLEPKHIHAYIANIIAKDYDFRFSLSSQGNDIVFFDLSRI